MRNKSILLLGASGGIGTAIYEALVNDFTIDMPSSKEIDFSNFDSINDYFSERSCEYDFIVYSAGVNNVKSFENVTETDLIKTIHINLTGLLSLTKKNLEYWKNKQAGGVIAIGSLFSTSAKTNRLPYIVSKHGLYGLVKSLSIELAKYNVMVNMISPGYIETNLTFVNNSKENIKIIESQIPLGRLGKPSEVAQMVGYLVRENTYITGQNIIIDGGISIDYSK
jgi:3-oxoacyl-[acyl-carrier protein] reductase